MLTRREFLVLGAGWSAGASVLGLPFPLLAAGALAPTEDNIEGPFYREGAPFRTSLAEGVKGTPLKISGRVLSTDGDPIPGALVDVWHADGEGAYDNESDRFLCRGKMKADREGRYAFETVMPGQYDLDGYGPRKAFRPAHIHYKVGAKGFKPLTTQLYFSGDKYLEKDPFARKSLVIDLADGKGTFDLVLAKA